MPRSRVGQFNPPTSDGGQATRSTTNLAAETQAARKKEKTTQKTS